MKGTKKDMQEIKKKIASDFFFLCVRAQRLKTKVENRRDNGERTESCQKRRSVIVSTLVANQASRFFL